MWLALACIVVGLLVWAGVRENRTIAHTAEPPQVDVDLEDLAKTSFWKAPQVARKLRIFKKRKSEKELDKEEELHIKQAFETWLNRLPDTHDYNMFLEYKRQDDDWEQVAADLMIEDEDNLIELENGDVLTPCDDEDMVRFTKYRLRAMEERVYDGIPFNQGGADKMHIHWFRMLGASQYGAEILHYRLGAKPWQFKPGDF